MKPRHSFTLIFLLVTAGLLSMTMHSLAQVGINADSSQADPSAGLDVKFSDKGVLIPRMTQAERDAIVNPANGLMVICTDCVEGGTISIFLDGYWRVAPVVPCDIEPPVALTHEASSNIIIWKWSAVAGAEGYKWNSVYDYSTATDIGADTINSEGGLTCNSFYTRYVWAYNSCGKTEATNLTKSTLDCSFVCGTSITVNHSAGNVAPVTKTVTYGIVGNIPGELSKCWITSNLGANHQATAVNDSTEESAGWYWQFNRKQGFKNDGTTRTPSYNWPNAIIENSDWLSANDPCLLELGSGWRLPTSTEWVNIMTGGAWTTINNAWISQLKIHAAGWLSGDNGQLYLRGSVATYNSNSQTNIANRLYPYLAINACNMVENGSKSGGLTTRCIKNNCSVPLAPDPGTQVPSQTQVVWNWNSVTGATGYKWNLTNYYEGATDIGASTTYTESGLACTTPYMRFIWAYNECGYSLATALIQTTEPCTGQSGPCPGIPTFSYGGKTYHTVLIGNQCWMKENLNIGTRIDTTIDPTNNGIIEKYCYAENESICEEYGGLYMWDEMMNYSTSSNGNPSGRQGICPAGWHLPSDAEWCQLETFLDPSVICSIEGYRGVDVGGKMKEKGNIHWYSENTGATNFSQFTALPGGAYYNAQFYLLGFSGYLWSCTDYSYDVARSRLLSGTHADIFSGGQNKNSEAVSVRCVKDNCDPPGSPTQGNHTSSQTQIMWRWNSVSGALGYKFNTTNDFNSATDLGTATTYTETGLNCSTSYTRYVWAYSSCGYSLSVTLSQSTGGCVWSCGDNISITHSAGEVAPVDKTVIYGTVTNVPGETSKCWITSNLGADHQATSFNDNTEASSGWYWQFNRKQGYKHDGTIRTPNSNWPSAIAENSDWLTINDPCNIELGNGWRLPTSTEWTNADAAGNWTNWIGPWSSPLKLHAAGALQWNDGSLLSRGSLGHFHSSSQSGAARAWLMVSNPSEAYVEENSLKTFGRSCRCIRDVCLPPDTPAQGTNNPAQTQITWNWGTVTGATGYKWNTVNTYATATDVGTSTNFTETGLTCTTPYTRYVWAYNNCGYSLAAVLFQSTQPCDGQPGPCTGTPTVDYGGKTYNTVQIGSQCWFKENLNIGIRIDTTIEQSDNSIIEKYCYAEDEVICDMYGGLYMWHEMMNYMGSSSANPSGVQGICPTGWHLPSDAEWCQLETYLDPTVNCNIIQNETGTDIGGKMKESTTTHWNSPNAGATNSSQFTVLPGGNWLHLPTCMFNGIGGTAHLWSCTENDTSTVFARNYVASDATSRRSATTKNSFALSVRCLKD